MSHLSRRHLLAGLAGVGALAVAGCGNGGSTGTGGAKNITLYNDIPLWKDGFIKAGETLRGVSGYGLEPLSVPTTTEYQQVILSSLQTPKTADVVKWWSGYRLHSLARTGGLTDLTQVWDELTGKNWIDPELRKDYSYQDKPCALPLSQSYWVIFYSKSLFEKAGIKAPTSWAEFESNAAALKRAGVTPLYTSQADGWTPFIPFAELVAKIDPGYYQRLTAGEASYTDPIARQALDIWRGWIERDWVSSADLKLDDAPAQMKAGKLAMIPAGTWHGTAFKKTGMVPGTDYGAFIMPTVNAGTASVFIEGGAWTVPSNGGNKEAAVKVVTAWLDPAVQKTWTDFLGDASANPTVVSTDPVLKGIQDTIASTRPTLLTRYWEASPPPLVEGNVQDLARFMLDPKQATSVLTSMQKRAETEWATWNKAGG
ncbi:ABC transporter substrate-binding protein [Plantactinospora sp. CA-290183]|uniref:ABC transporter substrate-binding protein n=1 Tax=Plantactinospora sp. CA-290183 TaxID=3240006 RepID=UPI003D8B509B